MDKTRKQWQKYNQEGEEALADWDYKKAEKLLTTALKLVEKADPIGLDVARVLENLNDVYRALDNWVAAESVCKQSLCIREKVLGPEHLDVGESLVHLALVYWENDNLDAATPLYERSLAIMENLSADFDTQKLRELCIRTSGLARLYERQGLHEKAEELYRREMELCEKQYGVDYKYMSISFAHIGDTFFARSMFKEAESYYQRALQHAENAYGPDHKYIANDHENLAKLYLQMGQIDLAIKHTEQAQKLK